MQLIRSKYVYDKNIERLSFIYLHLKNKNTIVFPLFIESSYHSTQETLFSNVHLHIQHPRSSKKFQIMKKRYDTQMIHKGEKLYTSL